MARRALLALAVLLTAFALAVLVSGGFVTTVAGLRVSSRSALPSAVAAAIALALWFAAARRAGQTHADLTAFDGWLTMRANAIVVVTALFGAALSLGASTYSASGSDASGYLSQAEMLWHGALSRTEPLASAADWFDGPTTLAPLGWRATADGRQVPTYAVGLPLVMAPVQAAGGTIAASALVALSFAVAIWATGALALGIAGPAAGIVSAVWLATSPVAIYEAMQPMSDVPVTAAWLACWWLCLAAAKYRPAAIVAGVAAAAAVLIRPNLAPLAAMPALYLLAGDRNATLNARVRRTIAFAVPVAIAGLAIAYLQRQWFGSAFRSGYGTAAEIYSRTNFVPNVALYTTWLVDTHGPWLLAAPIAWFWPASPAPGRSSRAQLRWLLVFAAFVIAAYLFYAAFEVWAYLRFLLPAMAIAMIAAATLVLAPAAGRPALRAPLVIALSLALAAINLRTARELDVFRLYERHARASLAGRYLAVVLPPNAVVVSGEQSGALRYYTGRSIVRWDLATPDALSTAIARLVERRYDVWIALDEWEEDLLRRKIPGIAAGSLDWPPAVDAGNELRTRAWRLRDRERFMRGETTHTDRLK